jgi:hypothetical protein
MPWRDSIQSALALLGCTPRATGSVHTIFQTRV